MNVGDVVVCDAARDDTCAICLDDHCDHALECGHQYHTKCIQAWWNTGKLMCPLCKTPDSAQLAKTQLADDHMRMARQAQVAGPDVAFRAREDVVYRSAPDLSTRLEVADVTTVTSGSTVRGRMESGGEFVRVVVVPPGSELGVYCYLPVASLDRVRPGPPRERGRQRRSSRCWCM